MVVAFAKMELFVVLLSNSKEEVELCEGSGKIAGEEGETQATATGTERKACTGKTSHISVIISLCLVSQLLIVMYLSGLTYRLVHLVVFLM